MTANPRLAFVDFTGCKGDLVQVLNLEEVLFDLLRHMDIAAFRLAGNDNQDSWDIAFVEGSITRPEEEARLREVRGKSALLIALGSCAVTGGMNCLDRLMDGATEHMGRPARPLSDFVHVDAALPGCPINREEFLRTMKNLLIGRKPEASSHPVCMECKATGNVCRLNMGRPCLGMIALAGCGAACVTQGATCWGCRGLAPGAELAAARKSLERHGFTPEDIADLSSLHLSCAAPELCR